MVRRTLEGALKCALRDFLREEWRAEGYSSASSSNITGMLDIVHTGVDLRHFGEAMLCRFTVGFED